MNNIVTAYKVTPLKRVQDLQFLLVYFADALEDAEKNFLANEFPKPTGQLDTKTEWVNAMGIDFLVFHN